jgi:hypothetical protein
MYVYWNIIGISAGRTSPYLTSRVHQTDRAVTGFRVQLRAIGSFHHIAFHIESGAISGFLPDGSTCRLSEYFLPAFREEHWPFAPT